MNYKLIVFFSFVVLFRDVEKNKRCINCNQFASQQIALITLGDEDDSAAGSSSDYYHQPPCAMTQVKIEAVFSQVPNNNTEGETSQHDTAEEEPGSESTPAPVKRKRGRPRKNTLTPSSSKKRIGTTLTKFQ